MRLNDDNPIERRERIERRKYQAERQRIFKKRRKTMMVMFAVAVGIVCAFLLSIFFGGC